VELELTRTERATGGSLCHIPLEDVVLRDTRLTKRSHSSGTASAESANDNHSGHATSLLGAALNSSLDISDQSILVGVAGDTREGLGVVELPCPNLKSESRSCETGVEPKRLGHR
jgi:hypothetical protein